MVRAEGERMRYGFTTGSCAAAAARAAASMLLSGREITEITVRTPAGISYRARIEEIKREEGRVSCAVRKDGGDDPDVTDGALIVATASFLAGNGASAQGLGKGAPSRGLAEATSARDPAGGVPKRGTEEHLSRQGLEGVVPAPGSEEHLSRQGLEEVASMPGSEESSSRQGLGETISELEPAGCAPKRESVDGALVPEPAEGALLQGSVEDVSAQELGGDTPSREPGEATSARDLEGDAPMRDPAEAASVRDSEGGAPKRESGEDAPLPEPAEGAPLQGLGEAAGAPKQDPAEAVSVRDSEGGAPKRESGEDAPLPEPAEGAPLQGQVEVAGALKQDPEEAASVRDPAGGALMRESEEAASAQSGPWVRVDGGIGVGRVTKPGLDQPVGSAAINRVPRAMIEKEALEACRHFGFRGGLSIEISVPDGARIAERTFNPRLGITGGISILGTSGLVEPMSRRAVIETIRLELGQHRAQGEEGIAVAPGNYGIRFMREAYGYDLGKSVKCGNFIGETVDMAADLGFRRMLLTGHVGKLVKVAGGIMNTHSREGDCRMELLASFAILEGAGERAAREILGCAVTEEALRVLEKHGKLQAVMGRVRDRACYYLARRCGGRMRIDCILYSNEFGELAKTKEAGEWFTLSGQDAGRRT